jgi:hypothetical protein
MRRYLVPAIAAGLAVAVNVTTAIAADLSRNGNDAGSSYYAAYAGRMEPVVIYDDQPGVIGRSYWDAPWANRHYFPKTGKRPRMGRVEHISARPASKAEDYFRFWSASSFDLPPGVRRYGIMPAQPMQ